MAKRKKELGRPMTRKNPPRIDATPEEMAQAMFALPKDYMWKYPEDEPDFRCVECKRPVHYPETLYRDERCEACHKIHMR